MKSATITKPYTVITTSFVVAAGLLLASISSALAAPATVFHFKKYDPGVFRFTMPMGGWNGAGPESMWIYFAPNAVAQPPEEGLRWIKMCDNETVVTIGMNAGDHQYLGTGSMVVAGLWEWPSLVATDKKMNYQIKATVYRQSDGTWWQLFWHVVARDGEVTEIYLFEPAD